MNLLDALIGIIILFFSAILHEVAHGFVADRLGDPTARLMGRLTLNPLKHIDPLMSIIVPFVLILSGSPVVFGAAKPVPVDPFNLREGRKDLALVSLAGPLTNILIALLASFLIRILPIIHMTFILNTVYYILYTIVLYNLSLAIFNLLPIPPLDGSKLFALLLPEKEAAAYLSFGKFGFFLLFLLLMFNIGGISIQSFIGILLTFSLRLLGLSNLPI